MSSQELDFTKLPLNKAIILLAIPMILEMLMESVFALVDILYVSKVSVNAVATIGLTESVVTLVYAFAVGLSMAATAMVARRIGEKSYREASKTAGQIVLIGMVISLVVAIVGILYARQILALMGGEPELIEEGYRYTQILLGGNTTIFLLFLINAIFRGAGNASMAMWALILSNGLNIILDPLFIFGIGPFPEMGVTGAAVATTIGRGVAVVFQLYLLIVGYGKIKLRWEEMKVHFGYISRIVKLSIGGIGQFLIGTSSWVLLMRMMSEFGSEVLAGYTIAIRVMLFTLMPAWGMSNAAATLVGQNLGAKEPDRAELAVWRTGKFNAYFMGAVSILYFLFAEQIMHAFTMDVEVVKYGSLCLKIMSIGYVFYGYGMVVMQSFNGAGDTYTPTVINFFCFWVFQIPFAYLMSLQLDFGPIGVFSAILAAETLIALISIYLFRKGKWKYINV